VIGVFVGGSAVAVGGSDVAVGKTAVSVGAAGCVIGTNTCIGGSGTVAVSVLADGAALLDGDTNVLITGVADAVGALATSVGGATGVNANCCSGTTRHAASTINASSQRTERTRTMHFLFKYLQNVIPQR
jgi:hypothetical protein